MPKLHVNRTTIAYDEAGDGPPLVLAHGLGLGRKMWRPQIEHFAGTNQVIAFDARGAGGIRTPSRVRGRRLWLGYVDAV